MKTMSDFLAAIARAPIVPVLTVETVEEAAPLADALMRGGLTTLEVTLRTPAALEALTEMKSAAPDLLVGAGTILSEGDIDAAMKAGADFLVTPGLSPSLAAAVIEQDTVTLPGVSTASEAMTRFDEGFAFLKFFPAEAAGGVPFLKSLAGPLSHLDFMPTGGITAALAKTYLSLPNVPAIGGSWMAPTADVEARAWDKITYSATAALAALE